MIFQGFGPNVNWPKGPAGILFMSRDAGSDRIAKLFHAWFYGVWHNYRAIPCKNGVSHRSACVNWWAPRLLRSEGVLVEVVFFENCRVTTLLCISA